MKKYVLLTYKIIVSWALVVAIVFTSITVSKLDEIVTENITLKILMLKDGLSDIFLFVNSAL